MIKKTQENYEKFTIRFFEITFLINGIIVGIKGFLSLLTALLVGALSDLWGQKPFLLITVCFTCAPIHCD